MVKAGIEADAVLQGLHTHTPIEHTPSLLPSACLPRRSSSFTPEFTIHTVRPTDISPNWTCYSSANCRSKGICPLDAKGAAFSDELSASGFAARGQKGVPQRSPSQRCR